MSLIQRKDVVTIEELDSNGLPHNFLINDTKIWVATEGINRTLYQAIVDKAIGLKGTAGSRVRDYGVVYPNGSTMPHGMTHSVVSGKSVLQLDGWKFRNDTYTLVTVNGDLWGEYVSDEITPSKYWKRDIVTKKILLSEDLSTLDGPIVVTTLEGVAPPASAVALVTGLKPINESYGTTNALTGYEIESVDVVGGKTRIGFKFEFDVDGTQLFYLNNKFVPEYKAGMTTYFKVIDSKTIELDSDYSTNSYKFYFANFAQKNLSDEFGNIIVKLEPFVKSYSIQSPNQTVWAVGVDNHGQVVTNDLYLDVGELIRLRRDGDNQIVGLEMSNDGELIVNDNPDAGIVFDRIIFKSPNGSMFEFGVTSLNEVYTVNSVGQKFMVQDESGDNTFGVEMFSSGAVIRLPVSDLQNGPDNYSPDYTYITTKKESGRVTVYWWNNESSKWEKFYTNSSNRYPKGHVLQTVLQSAELVSSKYGGEWLECDGSLINVNDDNKFMLSIYGGSTQFRVPSVNAQWDYWYSFTNHPDRRAQAGWEMSHPEGYKAEHLICLMTGMNRHYFARGWNAHYAYVYQNKIVLDSNGYSNWAFVYRKPNGIKKYIRVK